MKSAPARHPTPADREWWRVTLMNLIRAFREPRPVTPEEIFAQVDQRAPTFARRCAARGDMTAKPTLGHASRTEAMLALRKAGRTTLQIAAALGVSANAVTGLYFAAAKRTMAALRLSTERRSRASAWPKRGSIQIRTCPRSSRSGSTATDPLGSVDRIAW